MAKSATYTDFQYVPKKGATKQILASEDVKFLLTRVGNSIYHQAMGATPTFAGMRNNNYYLHIEKANKFNAWHCSVAIGNPASRSHNRKYNTLLKALGSTNV